MCHHKNTIVTIESRTVELNSCTGNDETCWNEHILLVSIDLGVVGTIDPWPWRLLLRCHRCWCRKLTMTSKSTTNACCYSCRCCRRLCRKNPICLLADKAGKIPTPCNNTKFYGGLPSAESSWTSFIGFQIEFCFDTSNDRKFTQNKCLTQISICEFDQIKLLFDR